MNERREDLRRQMDKQAYQLLQCNPSYFIHSDKLGVLEATARGIAHLANKRKRAVELNRLQWILKRLKLIPTECKVIGIALGSLDTGDSGLFVLCHSPTKLLGQIPEESKE